MNSSGQPLLQLAVLEDWIELRIKNLELQPSEIAQTFLPIICYWGLSSFFFILSKLGLTAVELHRIPTNQKLRPRNRITVMQVMTKVFWQHLFQSIVSLLLVYTTRPEDLTTYHMEDPWIVVAKLILAALLLDTYQVMHSCLLGQCMFENRRNYIAPFCDGLNCILLFDQKGRIGEINLPLGTFLE